MTPVPIQQRTFEFACRIVKLHEHLCNKGSATASRLGDQLLDSGTSISANLEEADAGQSRPDFISKCNIALKEARETKFWLRLLAETNQVKPELLAPLTKEISEIIAILTTIVRKSRKE
ncbi:MAG: four helix bundle protein [Anaerolineae bacterium]|nr:four helix bundle protein [Candidatus Roseilinea sp.]MDW8448891.1 four helix bundle protein [Anaerolineae bacterium]